MPIHEPTLRDKLAALSQHTGVTFRAVTLDGQSVWYAYWTLDGIPFMRRLGVDEDGLIARDQARHSAAPASPSQKETHRRTYSSARDNDGDSRQCAHRDGPRDLSCAECHHWTLLLLAFKRAEKEGRAI